MNLPSSDCTEITCNVEKKILNFFDLNQKYQELDIFAMEEKKLFDEELQLAEQMKRSYCKESVEKGEKQKETDPAKAAEILHKIALIYKLRSPDKISLIKCVGLLNAAILRNPSNISQVKADLTDVCKHVLKQANANNLNADLVALANTVKDKIKELRNIVNDFLKQIDAQIRSNNTKTESLRELQIRKAESIQCINKTIANKYKEIMADISNYCLDITGKPPCEYSIVGMGSLARNEITPYSDFEHIILLCDDENYEQHLEYFRWYSVIFHVIILNFQESIIPSLNIKSLSWYFDAHTPRGISFDGMMPHACKFPLGRFEKTTKKPFVTELIKPVSKMLKYLSSEEVLKNGYHLADILTKTCFVFGNENIFDQFFSGVKTFLSSRSKLERIHEIEKQVSDDLDKFSTRFRLANLRSQDTINIKQLVYRSSTLFVAALASIQNIFESSSFDNIQTMTDRNFISQTLKVKLSYAVAIACEMRLKVYMEKKSQCDNPVELNQTNENIKKFLSIVGARNTISYFQIAYCLQREVAKQLKLTKLHFYSDPQLINITIGMAFGMDIDSSSFNTSSELAWNVREFNFDNCIENLETKCCFSFITETDFQLIETLIVTPADHLFEIKVFDEALELYQQVLDISNKDTGEKKRSQARAWIYCKIGLCTLHLQKWSESEKMFHNEIKILQLTCLDQETDQELATAFNNLGLVLSKIYQYNGAVIYLKKSLEIMKTVSHNLKTHGNVAGTLNNIGICFMDMQQYNDALIHLKQSLEINKNVSLNLKTDDNVVATLNNIGICLMDMQQYNDGLIHLKQSLEIDKNVSLNLKTDGSVAGILNNIGVCLMNMQQYNDALIQLKQSLEICKNVSLNLKTDGNVADTLNNIGNCLMNMQQYNDALIHLKQSLEINKNASLNLKTDGNVATTLNNIGNCLMDMQQYNDALIHLKQSLEIYKNVSLNLKTDDNVATTLNNIGNCLMDMQQYNDALIHLKQSLEIDKNVSLNLKTDDNVATTLNNIGMCLMNMQQYNDALIHLKQSLEIDKNVSLNLKTDGNVAGILNPYHACVSLN